MKSDANRKLISQSQKLSQIHKNVEKNNIIIIKKFAKLQKSWKKWCHNHKKLATMQNKLLLQSINWNLNAGIIL